MDLKNQINESCRMEGDKRSTSDIISNLPSNVTENILKDLPLRDAVRTSVLSRKWRYKWAKLPQLVFDYEFFLKGWDNEKLKAVIYRVLLFHQGPLIKFILEDPPFASCIDINNWIYILLTKNIQEFTFSLSDDRPQHEVPGHLFSMPQLRKLNLAHCVFKPPTTFKGFSRLIHLDFTSVVISPEMCGLFISNCPLLERLTLFRCSDFDSLEINAPNLKDFNFCGNLASISLKDTPLLAKVSVTLFRKTKFEQPKETELEWARFFHSLPAIEDMHLDCSFLELSASGNVPERLPSALNQLKVLFLSDVCYSDLDHVSWALCLLRSSPNLLKFRSSILNNTLIQGNVIDFLQAQDFSEFSLNRLREVEIWEFSGAEPEIHFVKILLAHSNVLEKMVILHERGMSAEKGFAMLKKLIRFPRASLKAEVIVRKDYWGP